MKFRPFAEAKEFVHKLGLNNRDEWERYCRSDNKPQDIPNYPDDTSAYREYWRGWGGWLGTGRIAGQDKVFRPFAEARDYVHMLKLKNQKEWRAYTKLTTKPHDIPAAPEIVYKQECKGYGDWLGTGRIAGQDKVFRPFAEAREFVHALNLKNWKNGGNIINRPINLKISLLIHRKHTRKSGEAGEAGLVQA